MSDTEQELCGLTRRLASRPAKGISTTDSPCSAGQPMTVISLPSNVISFTLP